MFNCKVRSCVTTEKHLKSFYKRGLNPLGYSSADLRIQRVSENFPT